MPLAWYARSIVSALALVIALPMSLRCFADISLVLALPLLLPLTLLMAYLICDVGGSLLASNRVRHPLWDRAEFSQHSLIPLTESSKNLENNC